MNELHKLLTESTTSAANDNGRPSLIGLTKAVNTLIYKDLVATQPTKNPVATVYGVRYLNPYGDMSFNTPTSYSGQQYATTPLVDDSNLVAETYFKHDKTVYQAIVALDFSTLPGVDLAHKVYAAVMAGDARIVTEGSDTASGESQPIAGVQLKLDRWQVDVKTRKIASELTMELAQDMEANGFDSERTIRSLLASEMAEEINKDIIKTTHTVSTRHVSTITPNATIDLTASSDDPAAARTMYRIISDMSTAIQRDTSFDATYVVCTAGVAGLLSASGWVSMAPADSLAYGITRSGLKVYVDSTSPFEYAVVGAKHQTIDADNINTEAVETVGSLFYAPYVDVDGASYFVVNDPQNLQPRVMVMTRYGLSVAPYTDDGSGKKKPFIGDDWTKLVGKSKLSRTVGVWL